MSYCELANLYDVIPKGYLDAADKVTPGIVERKMGSVSRVIDDTLRQHYALPLQDVPETIKQMAIVMAAYEAVGGITAVKKEGGNDNKLLVLQDLYKQARADLAAIRSGKMKLVISGEAVVDKSTGGMAVVSRKRRFDFKGW
ncbi:MAG: phage protein Gp36 family protein [Halodesulfovibrio sp.]|uniref:phage protein Gp36 family protein n=1 Tax=Halodesulfovibrio sp. TaxID=1912772 RepID=UPI00359DA683